MLSLEPPCKASYLLVDGRLVRLMEAVGGRRLARADAITAVFLDKQGCGFSVVSASAWPLFHLQVSLVGGPRHYVGGWRGDLPPLEVVSLTCRS